MKIDHKFKVVHEQWSEIILSRIVATLALAFHERFAVLSSKFTDNVERDMELQDQDWDRLESRKLSVWQKYPRLWDNDLKNKFAVC